MDTCCINKAAPSCPKPSIQLLYGIKTQDPVAWGKALLSSNLHASKFRPDYVQPGWLKHRIHSRRLIDSRHNVQGVRSGWMQWCLGALSDGGSGIVAADAVSRPNRRTGGLSMYGFIGNITRIYLFTITLELTTYHNPFLPWAAAIVQPTWFKYSILIPYSRPTQTQCLLAARWFKPSLHQGTAMIMIILVLKLMIPWLVSP